MPKLTWQSFFAHQAFIFGGINIDTERLFLIDLALGAHHSLYAAAAEVGYCLRLRTVVSVLKFETVVLFVCECLSHFIILFCSVLSLLESFLLFALQSLMLLKGLL